LASWFEWQAFLPQKNKAGRHRKPVTGSARVPKRAGIQLRRRTGIVARSHRQRHEFTTTCSHDNPSANTACRPAIEVGAFPYLRGKALSELPAWHLFAEETKNHLQVV
jgi:hypothetical protein